MAFDVRFDDALEVPQIVVRRLLKGVLNWTFIFPLQGLVVLLCQVRPPG